MPQQYQAELDEFLKGKGLLGEPAPEAVSPATTPPTQDLQKDLDDFLWSKGAIELGGLRKETPETEFKPPVTGQESIEQYMEEPGFWQQIRDLAFLATKEKGTPKEPYVFSMAAEAMTRGVGLRNQEYVINLVGKIAGQPDLYSKFKDWQQKGLKKKLGYAPSPEVRAFVEAPSELAGMLIPLTGIFKGASLASKALTKVPVLRALAKAEIIGTATGLLRKPEDESFWNRLKQVPGDVAFFTLFEVGALGIGQGYKMYRWAKEFKGKPPKWAGTFSEYVPPEVGAREAELVMSKEEFRELLRKITTRPAGPESGEAFQQFISGLSGKERDVFTAFHGKQTWSEIWGRVKQEGILREVVQVPGRQPPSVPTFEAQRVPIPRQPKFPDIFKPVDKFGRPLGAPEFEPFPEEPVRPAPEEVPPPRPAEPPPPTEAPRPIAGAPPEAVPAPEVPPAPFQAGPLATVEVVPTPEGGWTIKIPQPTPEAVPGGIQPGPTIPWRPVEPELLPPGKEPPTAIPGKKPPKVIKPKKKPVFKNPFYEAINQQGGVAPNADYPYSELKQIFPVGLIKKTGMPMDTLAQAMSHEFPTLEGGDDVKLWEMADDIRRGRATFKDERTGDEHLPPREEVEAEAQAFADRKPAEMTKAEFNRDIKVAIKDLKTGSVHIGKPEERIHAQVWDRLEGKGIKPEDMEAGFVLPSTGQFIFSYSLKPAREGKPTPGPKYDVEVMHRELVKKSLDKGEYISSKVLAQHKIDYPELFKKPVKFEVGDTVEFDTITGARTGEITGINKKEGLVSIRDETGVVTSRELADLRKPEIAPEVAPKEAPRVAEEAPRGEKEPWQMTKKEYVESQEKLAQEESQFLDYVEEEVLNKKRPEAEVAKELGTTVRAVQGARNELIREDVADVDTYTPAYEHEAMVKSAIERGETVPPEVLADYPEMKVAKPPRVAEEAPKYEEQFRVRTHFTMEKAFGDLKLADKIIEEIIAKSKTSKEALLKLRNYKAFDEAALQADMEHLDRFINARLKGTETRKFSEVVRKEKLPKKITKEPTLTEIEKVFEEMAIPRIKRGVLADQIIRNYKPEKGPLKAYIKSILPKITEEGELRVKPTLKRKRAERLTAEMEEVVPGRAERPEDIFERAEEESRVQKIFKQSAKTDRERDVLDRKILKGQSYDDIGKAHGITRQRAEQIFKQSFEKVKDHPDVKAMIKRKMRQANLGPIPSEQDLKDLGRFIKKYFWSTKGVDKVVDAVNDKRIGQKLAEMFEATPEAGVVKKFLRKNNNEALDALVLDALKGDVPVGGSALPDEIKDAIRMMRDRIDKLSQLIITHGGLTNETKAVFERHLGRYVGKFYRLHQQRRWDPPKEVKDRFKSMLQRNYPNKFGDFTEEELDNFVDGIINEERKFGFGGRRTKRVPTGHYKRRIRLSREWKELAGEIHDPVWLYLKTISNQAVMAYNAEFLNKIKQTYPDLWVTNTTEAEKKGWQKYRLPANYGYGELRNKYVRPELYNYIIQEVDPSVSGVERAIMRYITNPFKWTKTIGSIPTHARNFQGNYMFSIIMRNSIFNPINMPYYKDSIKTFMLRNKSMKKEWSGLVRLGVTETQFWGAEIPKFYDEMLKLDPIKWPERIYNHTLKAGIARAGNMYNFEDALYRIASHYKNVRHFNMTPEESVAEINRGMTNYRKLPVVVEILRRYPVFGPFISFRWNVGKIVVNQAVQATREVGKEGTRTKGSVRLARLLFVLGIPTMIAKVAQEVFDVDEEQTKKLEAFYPKYRKNGTFVYFRGKEGQLKALDLTYLWPTGDIERGIRALVKGDVDTFKDAIDLFAHPIFDAWSILIEGRQPYWGTKIQGGFFKRMAEIAKLLWVPASAPLPSMKSLTESMKAGKFEPRAGILTGYQMKALIDAWNQEPDRYGKVRVLPEEVKAFFTGLRTWNVDPDTTLMKSIKAMRSEAKELKWELQSWLASNTKAPAWEIKDRTDNFNKRISKLLEKASEAMDLYKELKEGGFLVQKEK